jgi:sulfite reductase alpha subunit-like flavoprotein
MTSTQLHHPVQPPTERRIPTTATSHPDDPVPHEPEEMHNLTIVPTRSSQFSSLSPLSSSESATWTDDTVSDSDFPQTPNTEPQVDDLVDKLEELPLSVVDAPTPRPRRASTTLLSQDPAGMRRFLGDEETATRLIEKCCGGGCCLVKTLPPDNAVPDFLPVVLPDNLAFRSLNLRLGALSLDTPLTNVAELPTTNISFEPVPSSSSTSSSSSSSSSSPPSSSSSSATEPSHISSVHKEPPQFVQPHPPYHVHSAPLYHARELTKPGAEKRTFHFDIDVTDYPDEGGIDFKVGGAIGICPPNDMEMVDDVFDCLGVPRFVRDKPVLLQTQGGRWPTIWGEEEARSLVTTRRELLTWTVDIQSQPPTKPLLRVLAEHASAPNEKKILEYLVSAQGQAAFCDLRTTAHLTLAQLLHAFPSSHPPLPALLSVLTQLMPRFYSLSNDPHVSSEREGAANAGRRLIEIAVTIHETEDWHSPDGSRRTGVGSGFLERCAQQFIQATTTTSTSSSSSTTSPTATTPDIRIPMFRGLMANPLSREFGGEGPMMLIGAGVGMAPFRGFILNRLRNANCASKIWLVQGVRDSLLDEIYSGELGDHEREIKKVVQSRVKTTAATTGANGRRHGEARYVQDEVRVQADIVWFVINALDGRVFVCGSSKGMGEGVHRALVDVAMEKGGLSEAEAKEFWERKREGGQYIAVSDS